MPFTPFHLGPGAAFKAIGGSYFSFLVFGGAQVLMDLEPLVRIGLGSPILHGYTHTLAGALAIGSLAAVTGKPVSEFVLTRLKITHQPISWLASGVGAFVGTFSHIGLDAIMHSDMHPWWPFAVSNALLRYLSLRDLHVLCLFLGLLGAVGCLLRMIVHKKA